MAKLRAWFIFLFTCFLALEPQLVPGAARPFFAAISVMLYLDAIESGRK